MKLLLDENLSPRLIALLSDLYPDSHHVEDCGLISEPDEEVWKFARDQGFAIVSKDFDFSERSALLGSPPKVIWLRSGNCTTKQVEAALRDAFPKVRAFLESERESCLVLSFATRMPIRKAES